MIVETISHVFAIEISS